MSLCHFSDRRRRAVRKSTGDKQQTILIGDYYRFDQLMKVGWKVLLPLGLGVLLVTGIIGLSPEIAAWLKGVV